MLAGIIILLVLILKKINPMIALLFTSIAIGTFLGMPGKQVMISSNNGMVVRLAVW